MNPAFGEEPITMTQIGLVHTCFNVAATAVMYPFANWLVKISARMAGVKEGALSKASLHLDDRILENPSFAIQSCIREMVRMGQMTVENLRLGCEAVMEKDQEKLNKVIEHEENIDLMQKEITLFLAKICGQPSTSAGEYNIAAALFHTVNDIERVGDHSVNLAETAETMIAEDAEFSPSAAEELNDMIGLSQTCFENSLKALTGGDAEASERVLKEEEEADGLQMKLRANHMARLSNDECQPLPGIVFLDIVTNLERVTDHAKNIAQAAMKFEKVRN
jgi:phosphate:Na+ symporter